MSVREREIWRVCLRDVCVQDIFVVEGVRVCLRYTYVRVWNVCVCVCVCVRERERERVSESVYVTCARVWVIYVCMYTRVRACVRAYVDHQASIMKHFYYEAMVIQEWALISLRIEKWGQNIVTALNKGRIHWQWFVGLTSLLPFKMRGSPYGEWVYVQDCDIGISKFKL